MEIKWYQLLFQVINFGVLVFILSKFLYRPIITIIERRQKKIEDSIRAAEETLAEKDKIAALKKKAVEEAEKEAVKIVEAAKLEAGHAGRQVVNAARQEAELEVGKKLRLLSEKLAEEERKITQRLADLVVKATAQVLKDGLSEKDQRQIIDRQIKKLS